MQASQRSKVAPFEVMQIVDQVATMRAAGHDVISLCVGEPGGGTFRPFDTLFTSFIPALRDAGLTNEEIHLLTVRNPGQAFAIWVRRGGA